MRRAKKYNFRTIPFNVAVEYDGPNLFILPVFPFICGYSMMCMWRRVIVAMDHVSQSGFPLNHRRV